MKQIALLVCVGVIALGCDKKEEAAPADPAKKTSRLQKVPPPKPGQPIFVDDIGTTQPAKK